MIDWALDVTVTVEYRPYKRRMRCAAASRAGALEKNTSAGRIVG